MNTWAFFDADNGAEITRGWQGYTDQARALAQRFANERDVRVEFLPESELGLASDDGYEPPNGEVVEPD